MCWHVCWQDLLAHRVAMPWTENGATALCANDTDHGLFGKYDTDRLLAAELACSCCPTCLPMEPITSGTRPGCDTVPDCEECCPTCGPIGGFGPECPMLERYSATAEQPAWSLPPEGPF